MDPRGIRNHNPGNLRKSQTYWMGLAEEQNDPAFYVFSEAKYGLRALYKVLLTYQSKYKLRTTAEIINRWAPPVENDTGAYIKSVCASCGIHADEEINLRKDKALAVRFIAAIVLHENGEQPYSDEAIEAAIRLAL